MLQQLSAYYPDRWTDADYGNRLYVLVGLQKPSTEYNNIAESRHDITRICRVQHPLSYLRYALQDEYLTSRDEPFSETIRYHVVSMKDLAEALDYNCDIRRYSDLNIKLDVFSNTFPNNSSIRQGDVVIIVKFRISTVTTEKNYYPMYVLYFQS